MRLAESMRHTNTTNREWTHRRSLAGRAARKPQSPAADLPGKLSWRLKVHSPGPSVAGILDHHYPLRTENQAFHVTICHPTQMWKPPTATAPRHQDTGHLGNQQEKGPIRTDNHMKRPRGSHAGTLGTHHLARLPIGAHLDHRGQIEPGCMGTF